MSIHQDPNLSKQPQVELESHAIFCTQIAKERRESFQPPTVLGDRNSDIACVELQSQVIFAHALGSMIALKGIPEFKPLKEQDAGFEQNGISTFDLPQGQVCLPSLPSAAIPRPGPLTS